MPLSEAEKKRRQRNRNQIFRAIEMKFKQVEQPEKIIMNFEKRLIEELADIGEFFELSNRSRSMLINKCIEARVSQLRDLIGITIERVGMYENEKEAVKALAIEIALTGGSSKDLIEATQEYVHLKAKLEENNLYRRNKIEPNRWLQFEAFQDLLKGARSYLNQSSTT